MSKFSRKQAILSKQREELYIKINSFNDNWIELVEKVTNDWLQTYAPDETSKSQCSQCTKWEPGSSWECNELGIVCKGRCKECDIECYNQRKACTTHFIKASRKGFIYQSTGDLENDINNVLSLTEEIINDNYENKKRN
jgi:hypothetical protein